jgi:outer membrane protein OmpA-like peptidoglycan-associated protein
MPGGFGHVPVKHVVVVKPKPKPKPVVRPGGRPATSSAPGKKAEPVRPKGKEGASKDPRLGVRGLASKPTAKRAPNVKPSGPIGPNGQPGQPRKLGDPRQPGQPRRSRQPGQLGQPGVSLQAPQLPGSQVRPGQPATRTAPHLLGQRAPNAPSQAGKSGLSTQAPQLLGSLTKPGLTAHPAPQLPAQASPAAPAQAGQSGLLTQAPQLTASQAKTGPATHAAPQLAAQAAPTALDRFGQSGLSTQAPHLPGLQTTPGQPATGVAPFLPTLPTPAAPAQSGQSGLSTQAPQLPGPQTKPGQPVIGVTPYLPRSTAPAGPTQSGQSRLSTQAPQLPGSATTLAPSATGAVPQQPRPTAADAAAQAGQSGLSTQAPQLTSAETTAGQPTTHATPYLPAQAAPVAMSQSDQPGPSTPDGDLPASSAPDEPAAVSPAASVHERLRVATPVDGVGFRSGSRQLIPGSMERWWAGLDPLQRAALMDPSMRFVLTASASRLGTSQDNMNLAFARFNSVYEWLQNHGVQAQVDVRIVGETLAEAAGKPPNSDDPVDRVVKIEITPRLTPNGAAGELLGGLPQPTRESTLEGFGRLVVDIGLAFVPTKAVVVRDILTGQKPLETILDALSTIPLNLAGVEAKYMTKLMRESRGEYHVSADFIPGFRSEIERLSEGTTHTVPAQYNAWSVLGKAMANQTWSNLPQWKQKAISELAKSDRGGEFRGQLDLQLRQRYISKDIRYIPDPRP